MLFAWHIFAVLFFYYVHEDSKIIEILAHVDVTRVSDNVHRRHVGPEIDHVIAVAAVGVAALATIASEVAAIGLTGKKDRCHRNNRRRQWPGRIALVWRNSNCMTPMSIIRATRAIRWDISNRMATMIIRWCNSRHHSHHTRRRNRLSSCHQVKQYKQILTLIEYQIPVDVDGKISSHIVPRNWYFWVHAHVRSFWSSQNCQWTSFN